MTLHEVNDAASIINEEAGEDANVIFGAVIDDRLTDEFRVTVIATGFNANGRSEQSENALDAKAMALADSLKSDGLDVEIPAYQRDHLLGEIENDLPLPEDPNVAVYGNDLDVPAILRARLS